jgi:hypothetical protein
MSGQDAGRHRAGVLDSRLFGSHGEHSADGSRLGLGGVWTALYPLKERYKGIQQLQHLPKKMIPLNTLIIGYPKNQAEAKDKWKEENVSYNKWMEKNS